jgi:hypothetical protein
MADHNKMSKDIPPLPSAGSCAKEAKAERVDENFLINHHFIQQY